MTILILYATVALFGFDATIRVASFPNPAGCELARAEYQRQVPQANFQCEDRT
jgi:hypothetical protein